VSAPPIDTEEFRRSTAFSRLLRWSLRRTLLPRFDAAKREAYDAQFDDASRNVEITVSGLGRLLNRHAIKSAFILGGLGSWASNYFGAQRDTVDQDRYLVYTEQDVGIPFQPDYDLLYSYIISHIAHVANAMLDSLPLGEVRLFCGCFNALNRMGAEAFHAHPTVMPRLHDHDRLGLRVIQALDRPLNCCPSLHIAYSLLLYNAISSQVMPHCDDPEVLESTRYVTAGMFNSVLYTKQHSILDVAFGMAAAKMVYEETYEAPFHDFSEELAILQRDHPIPYDEAVEIYHQVGQLVEHHGGMAGALGVYLQQAGYQVVAPGDDINGWHFDTRTRKIVRD